MKEIKSHVERNLKMYLQSPTFYLYISGQLATRLASGFQVILRYIGRINLNKDFLKAWQILM